MNKFIDGLKANDLIACKKAFNEIMQTKTQAAIDARREEIVQSIKADGEVEVELPVEPTEQEE